MFRSTITCRDRINNFSTTRNLLFGDLQHPYPVIAGHQFIFPQGTDANSWPGDKLQQGRPVTSPMICRMTVSRCCFSGSARFQFFIAALTLSLLLEQLLGFTHAMPE